MIKDIRVLTRNLPRLLLVVLAALLAITTTSFPGAAAAAPPGSGAPSCAPGVGFSGFSDALDKTSFEDTNIGGLSALTYDQRRGVYYSLVDNEEDTPARFYTLRVPLDGAGLGEPSVLDVTTLRDASGEPFTGSDFDGEGHRPHETGRASPRLGDGAFDPPLLAERASPGGVAGA